MKLHIFLRSGQADSAQEGIVFSALSLGSTRPIDHSISRLADVLSHLSWSMASWATLSFIANFNVLQSSKTLLRV